MPQFATVCEPHDIFNPVNVYRPERRAAVYTSAKGNWRCALVPPAILAPGVLDEGTWPRFVLIDGQQIFMHRNDWDNLKLARTHTCYIPERGFPTATLRTDVPELDSDSESDASSEGTATPRAVPTTPVTRVASLDDELDPGSPMESVHSHLKSVDAMSIVSRSDKMSIVTRSSARMDVDTESIVSDKTIRSNGSSNVAPNVFGKRAKARTHVHPAERAPKRHHVMRNPGPRYCASRASKERDRQRQEYLRKRRIETEQAELLRMAAEEALRREQLRVAELRAQELEQMRRRIAEMDAKERLDREAFLRLEHDRAEAARALAARRMNPVLFPAQEAFVVWQERIEYFNQIRRKGGKLHVRDIPFPVLFRPEYSLHLVNEASVAAFFTACAGFLTHDKLKKARVILHPDHFSGRQYAAGLGYEDEAQTAFVVDVMKVVSAYVNDNLSRQ